MRKRLLSLALALVLCLGLTAPVAAAEVTAVKPLEEEYTRAFNYRVYSDGMLAVEKKDSAASGYIYLDRNGNELSGALFTEGMDFSEGLAAVQPKIADWKDYKGYGYADKTGKIVIEPQFRNAGQFHDGVARVQDNETQKWGVIDKNGNVVIPLEYGGNNNGPYVHEPADGLILAYDEPSGYWGYFDTKGNITIPFQYAYADDFHAGYAKVRLGQKETYIDKTGRDILGDHYEYPEQLTVDGEPAALFSVRDTAATRRNSYYVFNDSGQVVAGPYDSFGRGGFDKGFVSGLMAVCKADDSGYRYGYINIAGQEVIPCGTYKPINSSAINAFVDGYALVSTQDNTRVIINTAGQITATLSQDLKYNAEKWSQGFLAVSSDASGKTRWGFINASGQQVVECRYAYVGAFSSGVAVVRDFADKYGLVNTAGQEIVPCKYSSIGEFINGVAVVSMPHHEGYFGNVFGYGLINTAGQEILPCVYDEGLSIDSGSVAALNDTLRKGGQEVCAILQNLDTNRYDFIRVATDYAAPASTTPVTPAAPAQPKGPSANPTNSKVLVNGKEVAFDAYTIDGSNYFKLRDLAYVLNGTEKQFEVGWDNASKTITLTSGGAYTANGSEMAKGSGTQSASVSASKLLIDGKEVSLTAYTIGGNNYFKLRDIGQAFDFGIGWDNASKTITIDTSAGYTA